MEAIETRLRKLEATNRMYKRVSLFLIAGIVLSLMAFRNRNSVPDVIQAKSFEVVDDDGHVLVQINQDKGFGLMRTYTSAGKKLVNITYTTKNEGFIAVEDGNGRENIRLSSSGNGGGYISVYNTSSQRVGTMSAEDGGGFISVSNNSGSLMGALKSHVDGGGFLGLYNNSGNPIINLLETTSGNGDLHIRNSDGDDRIRFSVSDAGGNFQLFNNSKTKVVEIGATAGQNGIVNTYNLNGEFINSMGGSN